MSVKNELWVHKHRPKSLEELALSEENRKLLQSYLDEGEIPNLLFAGPPGVGKTAAAQILTANIDCRVLTLNASSERGIDTIRNKVGTFAKSRMGTRWNVVFLDEADALTRDAQDALRNFMESYIEQTRFILTANYIQRIRAAIRSRCVEIELADLSVRDRAKILVRILKKEQVPLDKDTVLSYATTYTDLRRMIQAADKSVSTNGKLLPAKVSSVDGDTLWNMINKKNWKGLVTISKDPNTDHVELLKEIFWAIPDDAEPHPSTLRSIVEEKLSTSTFAPDKVVHFLGTCATLMKEM